MPRLRADPPDISQKMRPIGLGHVGLPLAVEFAKQCPVVNFDINSKRIAALQAGDDATCEVTAQELAQAGPTCLHRKPARPGRLQRLHRHRPHPIQASKAPDL